MIAAVNPCRYACAAFPNCGCEIEGFGPPDPYLDLHGRLRADAPLYLGPNGAMIHGPMPTRPLPGIAHIWCGRQKLHWSNALNCWIGEEQEARLSKLAQRPPTMPLYQDLPVSPELQSLHDMMHEQTHQIMLARAQADERLVSAMLDRWVTETGELPVIVIRDGEIIGLGPDDPWGGIGKIQPIYVHASDVRTAYLVTNFTLGESCLVVKTDDSNFCHAIAGNIEIQSLTDEQK